MPDKQAITTLAEARDAETRLMQQMTYDAAALDRGDTSALARYLAAERGLAQLRRGMKRHFRAELRAEPTMTDQALLAALAE